MNSLIRKLDRDRVGKAALRAVAKELGLPELTDEQCEAIRYQWACANYDDQPYENTHYADISPSEMAYNLLVLNGQGELAADVFEGNGPKEKWPSHRRGNELMKVANQYPNVNPQAT